jgi:uncharacterized protein (TIGR03435 family)
MIFKRIARRLIRMALLVLLTDASGSPSAVAQDLRVTASPAQSSNSSEIYEPHFAYDVAAIREDNAPLPYTMKREDPLHSGSLRATNLTAQSLMSAAYGASYFLITGGPEWVTSTRFDIQARADTSVEDALAKLDDRRAALEKQHMLQALLAERFKLVVHTETRQGTAFELAVDKSGAKLTEAEPPSEPAQGSTAAANPDQPGLRTKTDPSSHVFRLIGHSVPIGDLCEYLGDELRTTVVDRTGLAKKYDFTLRYLTGEPSPDSKWPDIFTALREQLGLILKSAKVPVSVLVIDHIEKPSVD